MRVPTQIPPTIFETFPRVVAKSSSAPPRAFNAASQFRRIAMSNEATSSTQQPLSFSNYKIENTTFPSADRVSLNDSQQVITGSILDLFAGKPSLRKLSLWLDDATFEDPLTIAEGRNQYAAQWYGLRTAFSDIERPNCSVSSSGNPIEVDMKNKYTLKGVKSEHTIDSKVKIWTEGVGDQMKIRKVEDRWEDDLSDGAFMDAMRKVNSAAVHALVSVPRSIEDEERGR